MLIVHRPTTGTYKGPTAVEIAIVGVDDVSAMMAWTVSGREHEVLVVV